MRINESKNTPGIWYILDDCDNIIQMFYSKQKAMNWMKKKKKKNSNVI